MKVIDPGHQYRLDAYDGGEPQQITFMKREGDKFPFNVGHYGGTNLQEVLRVLIDRVKYLDKQSVHLNDQKGRGDNKLLIGYLRSSLLHLERRAAIRHGWDLTPYQLWDHWEDDIQVESIATCSTCGHITCKGHIDDNH